MTEATLTTDRIWTHRISAQCSIHRHLRQQTGYNSLPPLLEMSRKSSVCVYRCCWCTVCTLVAQGYSVEYQCVSHVFWMMYSVSIAHIADNNNNKNTFYQVNINNNNVFNSTQASLLVAWAMAGASNLHPAWQISAIPASWTQLYKYGIGYDCNIEGMS